MLAGGRGSRLGGIEKGEIRIDGQRLVETVVNAALDAGCERAIVVGDLSVAGAASLREDPPFGGPVAGLAAALPEVRTEWLMLLACDLPGAGPLCRMLVESMAGMPATADGLVATDGQPQWLAGIYRREPVAAAIEALEVPASTSLKAVFGGLRLHEVPDQEGLTRDLDTPEDLEGFTRERKTDE